MSLKTRVFLLTHPGTAVETQKRALLERHHAAIERVLGKAKSLSQDSQRTLKDITDKTLRDVVKR
jgi:hypothetical protein